MRLAELPGHDHEGGQKEASPQTARPIAPVSGFTPVIGSEVESEGVIRDWAPSVISGAHFYFLTPALTSPLMPGKRISKNTPL